MAIDAKYGKVTVEKTPGNPLGEDEPVIVFRARDRLLPVLLMGYFNIAEKSGCELSFRESIARVQQNVDDWQAAHPDLVKLPD